MVELVKAELDRSTPASAGDPGAQGASSRSDLAGCPLVTIGLPVFNGAATLGAALETLVQQDYPNLQIIVSDNASTDWRSARDSHNGMRVFASSANR